MTARAVQKALASAPPRPTTPSRRRPARRRANVAQIIAQDARPSLAEGDPLAGGRRQDSQQVAFRLRRQSEVHPYSDPGAGRSASGGGEGQQAVGPRSGPERIEPEQDYHQLLGRAGPPNGIRRNAGAVRQVTTTGKDKATKSEPRRTRDFLASQITLPRTRPRRSGAWPARQARRTAGTTSPPIPAASGPCHQPRKEPSPRVQHNPTNPTQNDPTITGRFCTPRTYPGVSFNSQKLGRPAKSSGGQVTSDIRHIQRPPPAVLASDAQTTGLHGLQPDHDGRPPPSGTATFAVAGTAGAHLGRATCQEPSKAEQRTFQVRTPRRGGRDRRPTTSARRSSRRHGQLQPEIYAEIRSEYDSAAGRYNASTNGYAGTDANRRPVRPAGRALPVRGSIPARRPDASPGTPHCPVHSRLGRSLQFAEVATSLREAAGLASPHLRPTSSPTRRRSGGPWSRRTPLPFRAALFLRERHRGRAGHRQRQAPEQAKAARATPRNPDG